MPNPFFTSGNLERVTMMHLQFYWTFYLNFYCSFFHGLVLFMIFYWFWWLTTFLLFPMTWAHYFGNTVYCNCHFIYLLNALIRYMCGTFSHKWDTNTQRFFSLKTSLKINSWELRFSQSLQILILKIVCDFLNRLQGIY